MPRWKPVVVTVCLLLSACVRPDETTTTPTDHETQLVRIEYEDGSSTAIPMTKGNGSIVGRVHGDAGGGLKDVHVSILSTDFSTKTNRTGDFVFPNLPPGKYLLRADRPDYRANEADVEVKAGSIAKVHVTLIYTAGTGGYAPHIHDYWAERTEVLVADNDYEFMKRYPEGSANYHFDRYYSGAVRLGIGYLDCGYSAADVNDFYGASEFYFTDASQLVWAGTKRIDVTISWDPNNFIGGDTMKIIYQSANTTKHVWRHPTVFKNGQTVSIDVEPEMTDPGHAPFTMWKFWICIYPKGSSLNAYSYYGHGRTFIGKFHAKMVMFKGNPVNPEEPHPRFWENGSTLRLLDAWTNWTCSSTSTSYNYCYKLTSTNRGYYYASSTGQYWFFRLAGNTLVPPGTGILRARLDWTCEGASNKPLSLIYSPANISPRDKQDVTKFLKADPAEKRADGRTYDIIPKPGETDAFYQKVSNWAFLWGNEGEESSNSYTPSCGTGIKVHLTLDAIKDPDWV